MCAVRRFCTRTCCNFQHHGRSVLTRSLRERNTGFAQVLVDLVVVFLRREKLSFLQNRAVIDFINPDEDEDSGFSRRIHRREKLSFFVESSSDPFY